ncbi:MAG TPA: acyl-CoA dehydrogenase [Deltaproteobacteria bacterium]|nr:acyl-CoA dehydrogenase [Deltaproteobacteria bacterium]HCP45795.1 acyl-CoA dehydrogenase [Deltaproteobacteria bacterium]
MDFQIDPSFEPIRQMLGWLGKSKLRPLGIEADRQGGPLPPDHPFFKEVLSMGMTGGFVGKLKDNKVPRDDDGRPRRTSRRAVVLAEEAAYWDRGMATSLPGPSLGGAPVMLTGTDAQKEHYLGMFKDKTTPRWGAFAMSEPGAGSDVARIRTRAKRDGDSYVLSGEKCFISNGARASWAVVWATIDPALGRSGHRAFLVDQGTPGFTVACIEKKMGLAASETASLVFDGCRVPESALLGGEEAYAGKGGFKSAMKAFDMTRPLVAAMGVGMGRAAYDETLRVARERFTGPSSWRLSRVQDRLVRVRRKLEMGRMLAWKAAWLADHKRPNAVEAGMAKAYCAQLGLEAASLGLEVLGESGGASDYLVEKIFRDVKALDIVEGTQQIQRVVIARRLIGYTEDRGRSTGASEASTSNGSGAKDSSNGSADTAEDSSTHTPAGATHV